MADEVQVFRTENKYNTDLGKDVMPSVLKPIDYKALDNALAVEEGIAQRDIHTKYNNIEKLGKIQDTLTGIQTDNPRQAALIDQAKKTYGLTNDSMKTIVSSLGNPNVLNGIDRAMAKIAADPVYNDIIRERTAGDQFFKNIPKIETPELQALALEDYGRYKNDSDGKYKAEALNIDQYRQIDIAPTYEKALDQLAPLVSNETVSYDKLGFPMKTTVTSRDQAKVKAARENYLKMPGVMNNLIANGMADKDGNLIVKDGKTYFDLLESGLGGTTQTKSSLSNRLKGPDEKSTSSSTAASTTPGSTEVPLVSPGSVSDTALKDIIVDVVSGNEIKGDRSKIVHKDPGNGHVNIGGFSFNGEANARPFLDSLKKQYPEVAALVDDIPKNLNKGSSEARAKTAYNKIQQQLGEEKLKAAEKEYFLKTWVAPVTTYATAKAGRPLTTSEKIIVADMATQHGVAGAKEIFNKAIEMGKKGGTLVDNLTEARKSKGDSKVGKIADKVREQSKKYGDVY